MEFEFNISNFEDEALKSNVPVLVDFYADWCGPCQMMAPVIEQIADEHDEIKVGKINVDESPELAVKFGINSIPAFFVFENGEIKGKKIGYCSKEEIEKMLFNK